MAKWIRMKREFLAQFRLRDGWGVSQMRPWYVGIGFTEDFGSDD